MSWRNFLLKFQRPPICRRRGFSILSKQYEVDSGVKEAAETAKKAKEAAAVAANTPQNDAPTDPAAKFNYPVFEPTAEVLFPKFLPFAQPEHAKCGVVTLLGIPNSGKSTLTNALVGESVSIVTHKAQTTRDRVLGVLTVLDTQLVFQDTPGVLHAPLVPRRRKNVQKQIAGIAMEAMGDADLLLCVVDGVRRPDADLTALLNQVRAAHDEAQAGGEQPVPSVLIINKSDLCGARGAQRRADELLLSQLFSQAFCVSALQPQSKRMVELRQFLLDSAPSAPWLYNPNMTSDWSDVERAEEVVREKLYLRINQELPYSLVQRTEGWTPLPRGALRIDQTIMVPNERVKRILIGSQGRTIRQINMAAREELSRIFERPIHLFLHVRSKVT